MATDKKKRKDPLKSKSEWSIMEFQMWLHGAYALQGDDWVPNADQWELILDIIYKLKDRGVKKPNGPLMLPSAPLMAPPGYGGPAAMPPPMGPSPMGGMVVDVPPEANLSLSQLNKMHGVGQPGNGLPVGEKEIKTGAFE